MEITNENVDKPVDEKLLGGDVPDELAEPKKPEDETAAPAAKDAKAADDKKPVDEPAAAADEPAAPDRRKEVDRSNWIPPHRLGEVTEERNREREARERAEAELVTLRAAKAPPAVPPVDINALEEERAEALIGGDTKKYAEIGVKIHAENRRLAAQDKLEVEEAAVSRATQEMTRRESDRSYADAYAQTLKDYPFLDPKTGNPEAIAEALEWRDFLVAKGTPSHEALTKAAAKVAPAYAEQEVPDEPAPGNVTQLDPRKAKALARNAKDAAAQPAAAVAGVGNRAVPAPPAPANQQDWEKLSEAEREKLLA